MSNVQTIQPQELKLDASTLHALNEKGRAKQAKELYHLLMLLQAVKEEVEKAKGKKEGDKPLPLKKGEQVHIARNYALYLEEAVGETQDSESEQQIRDSKTAEMDVEIELDVYKAWNKSLETCEYWISKNALAGNKKSTEIWQSRLNVDNNLANANENQADGPVQSAQSQVQGDASNNQKITQLVGTINTMETMISGMLQSLLG